MPSRALCQAEKEELASMLFALLFRCGRLDWRLRGARGCGRVGRHGLPPRFESNPRARPGDKHPIREFRGVQRKGVWEIIAGVLAAVHHELDLNIHGRVWGARIALEHTACMRHQPAIGGVKRDCIASLSVV